MNCLSRLTVELCAEFKRAGRKFSGQTWSLGLYFLHHTGQDGLSGEETLDVGQSLRSSCEVRRIASRRFPGLARRTPLDDVILRFLNASSLAVHRTQDSGGGWHDRANCKSICW